MSLREACDKVTKAACTRRSCWHTKRWSGRASPSRALPCRRSIARRRRWALRPREIEEIEPAIAEARAAGVNAIGPVPADTVFYKTKQGMYDLTIALYHDQGLGAVKLLGFGTVVTLLVGLPFIRTSTGHGTAFDIAGKGIADHKNLLESIKVAADLGGRRRGAAPRAVAGA